MDDFNTMIKGSVEGAAKAQSMMVYCDFIADLIKHTLPGAGCGYIKTGAVQPDLHPEGKYLVSSKKVIEAEYQGRKYKITVEEA